MKPTTPLAIPALCHRCALVGGFIWLIGMAALQPGWPSAILLLAALVLVPLALALVSSVEPFSKLLHAAAWLQLPAALILLAAFALPAGPLAGCLSLPWLAFTSLVALIGVVRFWQLRPWSIGEIGIDASLSFLAIGGMWTAVSRWGARPMGFDEPIILLTGIHFHYAGLILPLLTGLAAREWKGALSRCAIIGVLTGVPLVALGINLSPLGVRLPEWLASILMSVAGFAAALLQLRLARKADGWFTRALLVISGLSLIVGMVLAAIYATGVYWSWPWLDIPTMVFTHGVINTWGFAAAGLLAWNRLNRARSRAQ